MYSYILLVLGTKRKPARTPQQETISFPPPVLARSRAGAMAPCREAQKPPPVGRARRATAVKHGLCARTLVLLDDENAAAFGAFEAAVRAELAPAGALQADLVARIVVAAWRARRADRLEAALLGEHLRMARAERGMQDGLGLELIRDCNGPRSLETLLRYRGVRRAVPLPRDAEAPSGRGRIATSPSCELAARCRSPVHRPHDETNPVLRGCGMKEGRPPRARGGRAGSEIGTNPGPGARLLA
jgi:hypothetical protein